MIKTHQTFLNNVKSQKCRSCCNDNLIQILDLGFAPPSNSLIQVENLFKSETHYPLVLLFCQNCKLIQTLDFHSEEALFTSEYPYLSSTSKTWVKHSGELVDSLINEYALNENSLVAEIASNDGYLLDFLSNRGIPNYGIEPTRIAAQISVDKGHSVYNTFLNLKSATQIVGERGLANVVIANNVFAHVPDLQEFTLAAKSLLSNDGILIIEVQYFAELLELTLFDTIYHEHYSYFTITSLYNLLQKYDLGIFKVEHQETHGGSIRVYARNNVKKFDLKEILHPFLSLEEKATRQEYLSHFQISVDLKKRNLRRFFAKQQSLGNLVAGLGAAAKANTLINFLRLSNEDVCYIFDSAPSKQGKFLPGSHIPILPFDTLHEFTNINTLLVFPWNIADELAAQALFSQNYSGLIYRLLPEIKIINPHV